MSHIYSTVVEVLLVPVFGFFTLYDMTQNNPRGSLPPLEGRVRKVITLSAPMDGTHVAQFSLGSQCVEQMRYRAPYLQRVSAGVRQKEDVEFHNFGTDTDAVILPNSSCFTERRGKRHIVHHRPFSGVGHLTNLVSQVVFDAITPLLGTNRSEPIVLVHGLLGHSSNWWLFRHRLRRMGYRNIFTLNLGHPYQSMDRDLVPKLQKMIRLAATVSRQQEVTLIGHSMGGVLASHVAQLPYRL